MSRIICIDYGLRRCGIAVSDPMRIIATGLKVVAPSELIPFLKNYIVNEPVDLILIGLPLNLDDTPTHATAAAEKAFADIKRALPTIEIRQIDERYSSKLATRAMREMGMRKSQRRKKENVDLIAATMMLQEYMAME